MVSVQTFSVKGMSCEHCVRAVTEEVGKLRGVQDVTVELETGTITVTVDPPLEDVEVAAAVEEAGYEFVAR